METGWHIAPWNVLFNVVDAHLSSMHFWMTAILHSTKKIVHTRVVTEFEKHHCEL